MGLFNRSYGKPSPAGANATQVQIGEPSENKLARSMLNSGKYGVAALAGGLGGYGAAQAMDAAYQATQPGYEQLMNAQDRAMYDGRNSQDEGAEDYMVYQGIRQGLMGGVIEPADVNRMVIEGRLSERAQLMVGDIHDWGATGLDISPRKVAAAIQETGGDGAEYLSNQAALRQSLGISVPV